MKLKSSSIAAIASAAMTLSALATDPGEILIQAWVDGPSELRVKKSGIYWINIKNAKPGRLNLKNEPTYINGKPWVPRWKKNRDDRGSDRSNTFAMTIPSLDLEYTLVAVADTKDGEGIEERSGITLHMKDRELAIFIPDPEPGAKWYTFKLTPKT